MTPAEITALDTQFVAACAGDDTDLICRLADEIETYGRIARPQASLHSAALWYADLDVPVFPLSPGTKIPFKGSNGLKDATTDADQINGWWTARPDANIGLATGHAFDVVDVDGLVGQISRAHHWDEVFTHVEADHIAKVLTPSFGGMHLYVPVTGDANGTNIVPGVDYRGMGGYVVAPPSRLPNGRYEFLGMPDLAALQAAA